MPEVSEVYNSDRRPSSSSIKSHDLYASTPFKFIVQETAFYLHASLVSRHSRALDRMVNGDMLEAQKGYAVLNEVEEGTFARFAEWAYQGFYTSGEVSHQLLDDSELERNLAEDSGSDKGSQTVGKLPKEDKRLRNLVPAHLRSDWDDESSSANSSRTQLKESFIHRKATVRRESISIPPPLPNQGSNENYTDVFLSHAQVYVFAEKYDIQKLKMLALENLQNVLAIFTLYEERTGDIITLLRYVYANTSESIDGVEEMRMLMTEYMGYEMDTLMKDEEFRDLMVADGGALLGDFMKMVVKRIS